MATLVKYAQLNEATQREIKRVFVHWHYDTTVTTFQEWAQQKAFYVNKNGTLNRTINHCEPHYLAD